LLWLELTSSGAWKAGESRVYSIGESVGDTYDLDSPSGLRLLRQISLSDIVRAAVELAIVHRWEMPKLNFEISNEDAHLFMPTRVSYEFFPTFSSLPPLSPPAYEPFPSYEAIVPDPDTYDDRPRARRGLFRRQR
jgi:hypothetical protein